MTAAPSMAEVLAKHATVATGLGEWCCKCSPMEWRATAHRAAHVAQALADAGFGHVASVERERDAYRKAKQENDERFQIEAQEQRARAEAAEAKVAAVRELADELDAERLANDLTPNEPSPVAARLRAALDGEGGR